MLIDTHCHLGDPAFAADREGAVERMRERGVGRAVIIESELDRLDDTLDWVKRTDGLVLAAGCHPHDASRWSPAVADRLQAVWRDSAVRGAGEMGLDYHYDHSPRDVQRRVLAEQLSLAVTSRLPVIIHAREADNDLVAILTEQPAAVIVLHSFSSGLVLRDAALARGWYFSFSGMVTFRSWNQRDTVCAVPLDRLLVETDAPYLAPVPHRGRRNEPAFLADIARSVAEQRGIGLDELIAATGANAARLFWPG